jgi:O-antigen/teichoic acid export membrane protein
VSASDEYRTQAFMNRNIARGAAASVIFTATNVIVALVQLRLVIRFLPSDLAGLWLLFLTVGSYVTLFDLGISPTVGREMSFAIGQKDAAELNRNHRIGELLMTLWRVLRLLAVAAGVASLAVGELLILSSLHYRQNRPVQLAWALFCIGASLNLAGGAALAGLFGLGRVATEKLIRSVSLTAGLALTAATLMLHWGLVGLAVAWLMQGALTAGCGWFYLHRAFPEMFRLPFQPNWALAKTLVSPSLRLALIQLGAIFILQSANPLIAIMLGTSSIPPYEALSKIAATLMTLALLIVNSSAPYFSMSYSAGEYDQLRRLLTWNLQLGVGLTIILGTFVAINGDRMVAVWLGRSSFAGFLVLWGLLLMALLEVHHVIFATAVMAAGHIVFVWAALISGALNIVLAISLVGRFGLLGVALAILIAQLLTNNWYVPFVAIRLFKVSVAHLLRRVWLPLVSLMVVEVVADILIRRLPWLSGDTLLQVIMSFLVCISLGAGLWVLLVLRSGERTQILRWLQGWPAAASEQA